jgi:putative hydroxymethylpyrimidine transport system substrate-binding protein
MTMRMLIRLFGGPRLASLALPATAQDKVRLLLDWFVNPDHAAAGGRQAARSFHQARARRRADRAGRSQRAAQARRGGTGRVCRVLSADPADAGRRGLPLVRVGVLVAQPLNSLVALEDGPVKAIADFQGAQDRLLDRRASRKRFWAPS